MISFARLSATLWLILAGSSAAAAPRLNAQDLETWLDGLVPYALERGDIAGGVVVVVKDGGILLQKGYGYADVAKKIPLDPQRHLMRVASVSKLFTYTAVMQQVERGKLDLDRDVNDYLDFRIPPKFGKPVTLRHLMTHSAGFEERSKGVFTTDPSRAMAMGEYLRSFPVPDRIYPPGRITAYSNYSTTLAGYLVERVSGEPFASYVERHILAPLGMQHASFRQPLQESLSTHLAKSYETASSAEIVPFEYMTTIPAGGLSATATDMARFMLAHLQQGRYGDVQLLRPETTQQMHHHTFTPIPGGPGMTLGFFEADRNGRRIIGHWGDQQEFHSDLELFLDEGVGLFTSFNSTGAEDAAYGLRISLLQLFADRYFPGAPLPDEPMTTTSRKHARIAAGQYRVSRRSAGDFTEALELLSPFKLTAEDDGTLVTPPFVSLKTGRAEKWGEVAPFIWRQIGGRARLVMKIEAGRVVAWFPDELPSIMVFEPVPFWKSSALNLPLAGAAVTVLLLTLIAWPIGAIMRRRRGHKLQLAGREAQAYRLMRFAVIAGAVFVFGWVAFVLAVGATDFSSALDPWIRVLQLVGLACVAGAAATLWNAWLTWRGSRGLAAKLWSVAVALALLEIVWFSFAFHLMSVSQNY